MCFFTSKPVKGNGSDASQQEMSVCVPHSSQDFKCEENGQEREEGQTAGNDLIQPQNIQRKREDSMSFRPVKVEPQSMCSSKPGLTAGQPTGSLDIQEMSLSSHRNDNSLLCKRKWESSGQSSAFNEVLKKQKVCYDQGEHIPKPHDVVFRPIPVHNPYFIQHIQFTRPEEHTLYQTKLHRIEGSPKQAAETGSPAHQKNTIKEMFQKEHLFLQNMHQEAQKSIYSLHTMITRSNTLISELISRQEKLEQKVDKLARQNQELKSELEGKVEVKRTSSSNISQVPTPIATGKTFISNTQQLLEALYHRGQIQDFAYFLKVESSLQLPIYRERNFGFKLKLVDVEGKVVENSNLIMLSVSLYTTSNPPHKLEMNTGGFNILKQGADYELLDGHSSLEKLQIREVTSHYPNGWLFMIVEARPLSGVVSKGSGGAPTGFIDPTLIQPYILNRLVVKAKRMK